MEISSSFTARATIRTGLPFASIPDGVESDLTVGSTVCRRGSTAVVLVGHSHQDADGTNWYRRAVVVGRTADLPRPRRDATGLLGERFAPHSPRQRRQVRRLYGRAL